MHYSHYRHLLSAALLLAATGLWATPVLADWQPLDAVRAAAEAFVLEHRPGNGTRARAGPLDKRLRLARCDGMLEAFRPPGARASGNTTVGVRCNGSQRWKLFVPVTLETPGKVLIARRALPRGTRLGAAHLEPATHELTRLSWGYFTDLGELEGRELRRPVAAGTVIVPSMVAEPRAVRRGQSVTLLAQHGGIEISMSGTALMDGALDQRIRVENRSSGRVVEGLVRSGQRIEVLLQ